MSHSPARLAAIVVSSDVAIISQNLEGCLTTWNRAPSACSADPSGLGARSDA